VTAEPDDALELKEAAEALGVHYQTAYRWVRSGRLPARLVDGRYLVARRDIETVAVRRETPARPAPPSRERLERQADRMHEALLEGDEPTVRSIARRLVDEGTTLVDLIQRVLVPPLVMIGRAWHEGRLTIWVEHRASAMVERTLGELSPNPRGRRRGTAVVAAVSGDHHSLPTTMATVALRESNWHVHHLGADMPPDEIVGFCDAHDVDVVVISLTNPDVGDVALHTATRLRANGIAAIVGGPGRRLDELAAAAADAVRAA
jgi:excisionase family DNA binding protein